MGKWGEGDMKGTKRVRRRRFGVVKVNRRGGTALEVDENKNHKKSCLHGKFCPKKPPWLSHFPLTLRPPSYFG
jgi:hypothetical protein